MKGEYVVEETKYHHSNNMFTKLHQTQNFKNHHHNHQSPPRPVCNGPPFSAHDGATIEVVRRPRGRPPGSKNKPKPPFIITHDVEKTSMSPYILEVQSGVDIIDSIYRFCKERNIGLCVLNGSGTVTNVTLGQPTSTSPSSTITFHGRFHILSISATIVPHIPNVFSISVGGPQGQMVGGVVAGPLLSQGTVYLIAATFNNPTYHKLPVEDICGSGSQSPPQAVASGGEDSGHPPEVTNDHESCGISINYSSNHLMTDSWRFP